MENKQQETPKERTILLGDVVNDLLANYLKETKEHKHYIPNEGYLAVHWCCVKILRLAIEQPRYLDDVDKETADMLTAKGCSIGDIAYVLGRSKSSVSEYLNKEANTT